MKRLSPDVAVDIAKRLDECEWSWTIADVDKPLKASGLTALDPLEGPDIRIEHPDLPGEVGFVVALADSKTVLQIEVSLTETIDETDAQAVSALDAIYEEYDACFKEAFGNPDVRPQERGAEWDRGDKMLELLHLGIAVSLVVANKASQKKRQGG